MRRSKIGGWSSWDRLEPTKVTDCLDGLMGEHVGFGRDLLSRSICAYSPEISHEGESAKGPDWA